MALRARIVLLAADATPNQVTAERVGLSRPTVNRRRSRYLERGAVDTGRVQAPQTGTVGVVMDRAAQGWPNTAFR